MINNKSIPSKIEMLNYKIEENKIYEKIIENYSLLEEVNERLPLKIRKKIKKFKTKLLKCNDDKKIKIINDFNDYKNKLIYKLKKNNANYRAQIRRLENLHEWNNLNKEEKIQRETDLSFYRANILSYWLCLSTILFDGLYIIYMLKIMERNYWVGIFIIINIAILLFLFTTAIKIKNYKKLFCYLIGIFGVYALVRILFVIKYVMQVPLNEAIMSDKIIIYGTNIYCSITSIFIGISSYIKIKRKEKYIEENKITFKQMSK